MKVVWTCRRALQLRLDEYLVVGPSIVTDLHGMSDSMVAELFESVRLSPCSDGCAATLWRVPLVGTVSSEHCISHIAQDDLKVRLIEASCRSGHTFTVSWMTFTALLPCRIGTGMQVLGAVYVDGGLDKAREVYTRVFPLPETIRQIIRPPAGLSC